jgi:hypothetical protein
LTFKDLKKRVSLEATTQQQFRLTERLHNKPFWIWNVEEHKQEDAITNGDCCFNHIVGLPQKDREDKPLYNYEKIIFDSLIISNYDARNSSTNSSKKHLWIKKATGLGISEFTLRFMAWLCLKDYKLSGSHMCIVTGPRIDLAIALIDRMKKLFYGGKGLVSFDTKEIVIELNGVKIEAFPSHHLDAMRGLPNVSFILLDEADFFPPGQQQDARDVSERYIAKSNPYIVMISTPNAPDGLFERIEKEAEDTCLYKRIFLDYTYGIGKIYTAEEIDKAKQSPSFEREYNLKYLGKIGNVFHTKDIEAAIEKGRKYNLQIGEEADYDKVIARYKSEGLGDSWTKDMKIIPVNFNKEHKAMLGHCKMIMENDGGRIAINPDRFDKLITALRTAVDNDGTLDKEATSYNDIFDAFRLALKFYQFEESSGS